MNHLILLLENGRRVFLASKEYTDSQFCRDGGWLIGQLWDKSKVVTTKSFITRERRGIPR